MLHPLQIRVRSNNVIELRADAVNQCPGRTRNIDGADPALDINKSMMNAGRIDEEADDVATVIDVSGDGANSARHVNRDKGLDRLSLSLRHH